MSGPLRPDAQRTARAETGDSGLSWFGPSRPGGLDDDGWEQTGAPPSANEDSQFFFSTPQRRSAGSGGAFQRLYRAFLAARAALGLILVAMQTIASLMGVATPRWALPLCALYAVAALAMWLLPALQRGASAHAMARLSSPQWLATIGLDLLVFGGLHALDGSGGVSYSALFVLPVLMAGVLTPRLQVLAAAAMAVLGLLGVAWWEVLGGAEPGLRLTQAGLAGSGLFVIGLLASELASRLAGEERAARGSLELARQQAQLSQLVIDEMQEGVLVVDRRGRVRAANPAARALLAGGSANGNASRRAPFQLRGVPAWVPLVQAVERGFGEGGWPAEGRDVQLDFGKGLLRALRLRMRFTRQREPQASEDLCVLFIEDLRTVQARTRQEKLAAMGRVSAGIAHEIRNPLAAIDQANALIAEDCPSGPQRRLTEMVASNVQRLKRIVDDVMEVAPGVAPQPVPLDAAALVAEICADWALTSKLPGGSEDPLVCSVPSQPLVVLFDTEHLRRVLVNLLDNALRHAEPGPGSVRVSLQAVSEQTAELAVLSRGPAIAPDVERHLFEPFFSTRSRGSGLGLYICRELCERYGGRIDYRRREDADLAGNEFVLSLRRAPTQHNTAT
jgi:two-component system sensor histidine kinase PilS (NtrC family)